MEAAAGRTVRGFRRARLPCGAPGFPPLRPPLPWASADSARAVAVAAASSSEPSHASASIVQRRPVRMPFRTAGEMDAQLRSSSSSARWWNLRQPAGLRGPRREAKGEAAGPTEEWMERGCVGARLIVSSREQRMTAESARLRPGMDSGCGEGEARRERENAGVSLR